MTNPTASALAGWCSARGLSVVGLARLVGCSERAARGWLSGERMPAARFRPSLYRITELEEFRPTPLDHLAATGPMEREGYARATLVVQEALASLETSLQPFATGSPGAREFLRRSVDPSRVARITNLAQLLFDEEAFSDWLLLERALGGEET